MKRISFAVGALLAFTHVMVHASFSQGGPQPGDVYKEYAVSMGSNNWRVTDPGVNLSRFPEAAAFLPNPTINIPIDDLDGAVKAEILIDFWEGHDGTTDKKFRFNGKPWISIPEPVGDKYMQQLNHLISVPLSHLREGNNALEGTCGPNGWEWGQWGWYGVIVRVYYSSSKPHATGQITAPVSGSSFGENPAVAASTSSNAARVDFVAYHSGYDKDGDNVYTGWQRDYHRSSWSDNIGINNHVGTDTSAPYAATWNTAWVPDQAAGSIKLVARIRDNNGYWYVSPAVTGLTLNRPDSSVRFYKSNGFPVRYWVRVDRTKSNTVSIPTLASATSAIVHASTWNGDDGSNKFSVRLNGNKLPRFGANHFYSYDEVPVPLSYLNTGTNTIAFNSKTVHHGIEILVPAPGISVRYGSAAPPIDSDPDLGQEPATEPIVNGGFEENMTAWSFYTNTSGRAEVKSPGFDGSSNAAQISIYSVGSNVQFFQSGIPLEPNTEYDLTFAAKSNTGRNFRLYMAKHGSPYTNYGLNNHEVDLTSVWKTYTVRFTTANFSSSVDDGRLFCWFSNDARSGDVYCFDNIRLAPAGSNPPPEEEEPPPPPEEDPVTEPQEGSTGDPASEVVANGDFESGMDSWFFYTNGKGSAVAAEPGYNGSPHAACVETITSGTNIQLYQNDLTLEPNTEYLLSFVAYSSNLRDFRVSLGQHSAPFTNYGIYNHRVNLTTEWQVFTIPITTRNFSTVVEDGRLYFWFADDALGGERFYIDKVSLAKASEASPPEDNTDGDTTTGGEPNPDDGTTGSPDPATEVIANGEFQPDMSNWFFHTDGEGSAAAVAPGHGGAGKAALVETVTGGSNIQLLQHDLTLQPSARYRLCFYAYSNSGRDLRISLGKHSGAYQNYGLNWHRVDLSTSWQKFTIDFETINFITVTDGRLFFWFATDARPGDKFYIDKVSLVRLAE